MQGAEQGGAHLKIECRPFLVDAVLLSAISTVKAKPAIIIGVCGVLAGGLGWYYFNRAADLPRIQLANGGEVRVLQVRYTPKSSVGTYEHNLGGAPLWQWTLWRKLPNSLQEKMSMPRLGVGSISSHRPAISVWWAYIDPKNGKPELGPPGSVTIILDSGDQLPSDWPNDTAEGYREIYIVDPPANSKRLRFQISSEYEPFEFSIENPAFKN
jgi:hypothetical protein